MPGLLLHNPGLDPEALILGQLDVCFNFLFTGLDRRLLTVSPGERVLGMFCFYRCCLFCIAGLEGTRNAYVRDPQGNGNYQCNTAELEGWSGLLAQGATE